MSFINTKYKSCFHFDAERDYISHVTKFSWKNTTRDITPLLYPYSPTRERHRVTIGSQK